MREPNRKEVRYLSISEVTCSPALKATLLHQLQTDQQSNCWCTDEVWMKIKHHAVLLHHSIFVLIWGYQDVKPGDVMQKKNLWEIRDSSKQLSKVVTVLRLFKHLFMSLLLQNEHDFFVFLQTAAASKKYKFVVTGHGKYQKMAVGEDVSQSGEFLCRKLNTCVFHYLHLLYLVWTTFLTNWLKM